MLNNKTLGCVFIVAGTTLGAGMLALPMVTASSGFFTSALVLVLLWALMAYTALLTLEVNIHFPIGSSFGTMAGKTLGKWGEVLAFVAMILLFYALLAAYISGAAGLFSEMSARYFSFFIPEALTAIFFTFILGLIIYWKTQAVDYVNRVLVTVKIVALVLAISAMLTAVNQNLLVNLAHRPVFILAAIPVIFTSFGFHGSIPSVLKYLGHDVKRLRLVFILGSIIPLIIYLFWVLVTVGVLPLTGLVSFQQITQEGGSVGKFIITLSNSFHSQYIVLGINLFSNIAVTTSFLGVGLGMFDYFFDNLKNIQVARRECSALITFFPPLLFAIFYPNGFIKALGFAAIALAVLAVLLPAAMVWKWRSQGNDVLYKVAGGKPAIMLVFAIGLAIIVLQLLVMFHCLPLFA